MGPLLKHLKKQFCIHTFLIYTTIYGKRMDTKLFLRCFSSGPFHKSGHKCFEKSGPLFQIRSQLLWILLHMNAT